MLVASAALGCSKAPRANSADPEGELRLGLAVGGTSIASVHYVIQSSSAPPVTLASGDVNVSGPGGNASVDVALPPGTGCQVTLSADIVPPTGDPNYCNGASARFNVVAGQPTVVNVQMVCGDILGQSTGQVDVNATVVAGDHCPSLTAAMASPAVTTTPGATIDVSGTASDPDAGDTLTFTWTATAGSFAMPTTAGSSGASSATTYTCTSGGQQVLTLTVTDNHLPTDCSTSVRFPVTCVAAPNACGSLATPVDGAGASAPALAAYNPAGDFTIEGWVYPTALGGYQTIAAHWDTRVNGTASYALYYDATGTIGLDTSSTGSDELAVTGTAAVVPNRWNHVAATFTASTKTVTLFKDGAVAGTGTVGFSQVAATTGVPFTIGVLAMSAADVGVRDPQSVIGYLDEVRLSSNVRYTTAFTPANTLTPDASTLALYHLDEGSGTTAADASPAANTATLSGGATFFAGCPAGCGAPLPTVPNLTSGAFLICDADAGPLVWTGLMTFTAAVPTCTGAAVTGTFNWADRTTYSGETTFTGTYDATTGAISVDEVQVLSGNVGTGHDFMTYSSATDTLINGGWTCSDCYQGTWATATHVSNPATATCP
ncbi:MAG TPA: LamG-like jellyroll fold domain-containing protein [Polyangia bacterium]|nr:LamG-like jellyroll fold domain-containing protein [Polyangia bacterium]